MDEPLKCTTRDDIAKLSGQRVKVIGTYGQVDSRMRPRGKPLHLGHVDVTLEDGTGILLGPSWSAEARRSPEERAAYDGARVEVTGILHRESPRPPMEMAYRIGPTLSPVESIRLLR